MQYLVFDKWGGKLCDVKKSAANTDDDLMCWAAAASNVLAWTGWGFPKTYNFADENGIFQYFLDHWADLAGFPQNAWEWWFSGAGQPGVEVPGGGFWVPAYDFQMFYRVQNDRTKVLEAIAEFVEKGFGAVIELISTGGGHFLTCWGYERSPDGNFLGVYFTDSDNPQSGLRYDGVTQDTLGTEWAAYKDWWYLDSYGQPRKYLLAAVHALVPVRPQTPTGLRITS
jgi:hypothetical protein